MQKNFLAHSIVCLFILFMVPVGDASMVIEQVYVNPKNTESGGEALLLRNAGNTSVLLENWTLATQASMKDVILPHLLIEPNQSMLIADKGWNEKKDDPFWQDADLEETFTLDNTDGGVALINSFGTTIDAVGWGSAKHMEFPFYQGTPAPIPPEGKTLLRKNNTRNNAQDFTIVDPQFEAEHTLLVFVNVSSVQEINDVMIFPDDDPKDGIQIRPPISGQKKITVRALIEGVDNEVVAILANKTMTLKQINTSLYEGHFFIENSFPAGLSFIKVSVGTLSATKTIEILAQKKIVIEQKHISLASVAGKRASSSFLVHNQGNTRVTLEALILSNNTLDPYIEMSSDGTEFQHPSDITFTLNAGQSKYVHIAIPVPKKITSGIYTTRIRFRELST